MMSWTKMEAVVLTPLVVASSRIKLKGMITDLLSAIPEPPFWGLFS